MIIAIDFDEVLFRLVKRMMQWHKIVYSKELDYEKFINYRFCEAFETPEEEGNIRYVKFALSDYSINTSPIKNAVEVLSNLKQEGHQLFIASSSQVEVVESKKQRLNTYFPGIFEDFHAANHYSMLGGPKCSKADICRQIKADVIIDDNPKHLQECMPYVKTAIIFGVYPWNRGKFPGMRRAYNWRQAEQIIRAGARS